MDKSTNSDLSKTGVSKLADTTGVSSELADRLHDEIMQPMLVAKMLVGSCRAIAGLPERAKQDLTNTEQLLSEALRKLRAFSSDIHHPGDIERPLTGQLKETAERLMPRVSVAWELDVSVDRLARPESELVQRIANSVFANVAQHSGANQVAVSFRRQDGVCRLRIDDNGCGLAPTQEGDRERLGSIKRAMERFDGLLRVECLRDQTGPSRSGGTRVEVEWQTANLGDELVSNESSISKRI